MLGTARTDIWIVPCSRHLPFLFKTMLLYWRSPLGAFSLHRKLLQRRTKGRRGDYITCNFFHSRCPSGNPHKDVRSKPREDTHLVPPIRHKAAASVESLCPQGGYKARERMGKTYWSSLHPRSEHLFMVSAARLFNALHSSSSLSSNSQPSSGTLRRCTDTA